MQQQLPREALELLTLEQRKEIFRVSKGELITEEHLKLLIKYVRDGGVDFTPRIENNFDDATKQYQFFGGEQSMLSYTWLRVGKQIVDQYKKLHGKQYKDADLDLYTTPGEKRIFALRATLFEEYAKTLRRIDPKLFTHATAPMFQDPPLPLKELNSHLASVAEGGAFRGFGFLSVSQILQNCSHEKIIKALERLRYRESEAQKAGNDALSKSFLPETFKIENLSLDRLQWMKSNEVEWPGLQEAIQQKLAQQQQPQQPQQIQQVKWTKEKLIDKAKECSKISPEVLNMAMTGNFGYCTNLPITTEEIVGMLRTIATNNPTLTLLLFSQALQTCENLQPIFEELYNGGVIIDLEEFMGNFELDSLPEDRQNVVYASIAQYYEIQEHQQEEQEWINEKRSEAQQSNNYQNQNIINALSGPYGQQQQQQNQSNVTQQQNFQKNEEKKDKEKQQFKNQFQQQ